MPRRKNSGFSESPQKPLSGEPLGGSISDWANEIAREAESGSRIEKGGEGARRAAEPPAGRRGPMAFDESLPFKRASVRQNLPP